MASTLCSKVRMSAVSRPRSVSVRASSEAVSRRASFGMIGAVVGGLVLAQQAQAVKIPSQEFTGGLVTGGGSVPKSSSKASMEGYSLETGIKKSGLSPSEKRKIMADVKKKALS